MMNLIARDTLGHSMMLLAGAMSLLNWMVFMFVGTVLVALSQPGLLEIVTQMQDTISTSTAEECHTACIATDGCMGYAWFDQSTNFENYCFLYS